MIGEAHVIISPKAFQQGEVLEAFSLRACGAGAIVSFSGLVRGDSGGASVKKLTLQHFEGYTEKEISRFAHITKTRWKLLDYLILHRVGELVAREPIVFVATASPHRVAAFEAARYLMDYLKTEAPFWKKETRSDGEEWIEPRAEDYEHKSRWTGD